MYTSFESWVILRTLSWFCGPSLLSESSGDKPIYLWCTYCVVLNSLRRSLNDSAVLNLLFSSPFSFSDWKMCVGAGVMKQKSSDPSFYIRTYIFMQTSTTATSLCKSQFLPSTDGSTTVDPKIAKTWALKITSCHRVNGCRGWEASFYSQTFGESVWRSSCGPEISSMLGKAN